MVASTTREAMFCYALLRQSVRWSFRGKYVSTISKRRIFLDSSSSIASSRSSSPERRSEKREALRDFKDRLRPLGPGRVDLCLDDSSGLATLVLDNHDMRNGETHFEPGGWRRQLATNTRTVRNHTTPGRLCSIMLRRNPNYQRAAAQRRGSATIKGPLTTRAVKNSLGKNLNLIC